MEDAQASFQILRLSATSRLSHLLRTVPPSITWQAAANYDALVEWALASFIAGDGVATVGLPTPEEVAHDPTVFGGTLVIGLITEPLGFVQHAQDVMVLFDEWLAVLGLCSVRVLDDLIAGRRLYVMTAWW